MGAQTFVALAQSLEAKHGARVSVPENVLAMARDGGTFYGTAGKQAA